MQADTTFGSALKGWRAQRRMSQLDLGLTADVSARHISFLETGRSRPSRSMVMHLCETLQVPRPSRNALLNAAGFAQAYRRREPDDTDLAPVHAAIDWTLERHDPYPAMALDRHWTIVKANRCATMLIAAIGLKQGDSLLAAMLNTEQMAQALENWTEVARHMIACLRTESHHVGGDKVLDAAAEALTAAIGPLAPEATGPLPAVIPARYRTGDMILSLFSTLAQFGTAEDIALAELRIELLFPADEETRTALLAMTP